MAAHSGEVFVSVAQGAKNEVESGLIFGKNNILMLVGVSFDKQKTQHQIGAEIEEEDSAGEGKNMFEKASGEQHGFKADRGLSSGWKVLLRFQPR